MIIAHLADLHLGYRAYSRVNAAGVNQREADVAAVFRQAIEALVELRPDLVLIAGDVFNTVRPSNSAIAGAFRQLAGLSERLPGTSTVLVAGDRDTPRSGDTGSILELFREIPRVHVATERAERVIPEGLDVEVLAVPHAALLTEDARSLRPGPTNRRQVLVAHATLLGPRASRLLREGFGEGGAVLPEEALEGRWDYVALGHHPIATEISSHIHYAGSLERTSAEIWGEAEVAKGFMIFDLSRRKGEFRPLDPRPVVDLPRLSGRGLSSDALGQAIAARAAQLEGGVEGKIVRLVVTDVSRADLREIDADILRDLRAGAVHFLLDARAPSKTSPSPRTLPLRAATLEQQVEDYLGDVWTPTMDDIDRPRLVALGRRYLEQAGEEAER